MPSVTTMRWRDARSICEYDFTAETSDDTSRERDLPSDGRVEREAIVPGMFPVPLAEIHARRRQAMLEGPGIEVKRRQRVGVAINGMDAPAVRGEIQGVAAMTRCDVEHELVAGHKIDVLEQPG